MKKRLKEPIQKTGRSSPEIMPSSVVQAKKLSDPVAGANIASRATKNRRGFGARWLKPIAVALAVGVFVVATIFAFDKASDFLFESGEQADLIDHTVIVALQAYTTGNEVYEQKDPSTVVTPSLEYAINVSTSEVGLGDENLIHVPYGNWVPVVVDVGANFVILDYSHGNGSGNFSTLDFDGYVLDFEGNGKSCSTVEGATINVDGTNLALDSTDVTFSPHELRINVSSLPYSPSSKVRIDLDLAKCG